MVSRSQFSGEAKALVVVCLQQRAVNLESVFLCPVLACSMPPVMSRPAAPADSKGEKENSEGAKQRLDEETRAFLQELELDFEIPDNTCGACEQEFNTVDQACEVEVLLEF